jgi:spermidine synthase
MPSTPRTADAAQDHVKPYVHLGPTTKALHFSISEIQSRMALKDPYALDLAYTRTMMGFLLLLPAPRRLAMVGLGGGSLVKFCHRHLPMAHIEVAEINPHVIALRHEFFVPPDDDRLQVLQADGARYVRTALPGVDVVMVDGFSSEGQPARLCSQRFYDDCADLLQPEGVLVVNLHAGHRHHDAHVARIERSFGGGALVVDGGDISNNIVFASKGRALNRAVAGPVRRPKGLAPQAAAELTGAFARVSRALRQARGAPPPAGKQGARAG